MRKALIVSVHRPSHLPHLPDAADGLVDQLVAALGPRGPGAFDAGEILYLEDRRGGPGPDLDPGDVDHRRSRDSIRHEALEEQIRTWFAQVTQDDVAVFYFSGHGFEREGRLFLAAHDALGGSTDGWIDLTPLLPAPGAGGRFLVVLDCCHAGGVLSALSAPASAAAPRDRAMDEHSVAVPDKTCFAFLGAAPIFSRAPADSVLTPALIAALHGPRRSPFQLAADVADGVPRAFAGGRWTVESRVTLNPNSQSPVLDAYRASVLDTVRILRAPWEDPRTTLGDADVKRLIVQLSVRPNASRGDDDAPTDGHPRGLRELVDLDLTTNPWATGRWFVQGGPGAGKTTMLRRLARELATDADTRWIPVWAPLTSVARLPPKSSLFEWVTTSFADTTVGASDLLETAALEGRVVLLCDSLDELSTEARQAAERRLKNWSKHWPGPIIVAGRHHGVSLDAPFIPVIVQPLGPSQQLELIAARLEHGGRADRLADARSFLDAQRGRLGDLAGNPFYLTLIALLFASGDEPDETPARTYLKVVRRLLEGAHRRGAGREDAELAVRRVRDAVDALAHISLRMTESAADEETADEAHIDELTTWLDHGPFSADPLAFFEHVERQAGFIVRAFDRRDHWRFLHRAFREVLCAQALVDQLDGDADALAARAATLTSEEHLALWANPWALAAGLLADANPLLQRLLEANKALAVDALLNAHAVSRETFVAFLVRPPPSSGYEELEARRRVYLAAADKLPDAGTALTLVAALVARRLEPDERWFLDELCDTVKARWPRVDVEAARRSIYADLAEAPADLIPWSEVIPAGRFWMGSPEGVGADDEHPRHLVTLTRSYQLGTTPVTNRQWRAFDPEHEPYAWARVPEAELADHPVVEVSWCAAQAYCRWLSHSWGFEVRLPTEAEWERACRGPNGEDEANHDRWWFGDDEAELAEHAWYDKNSGNRTHAVGTTPAGAGPWGLLDMHGNVDEWCGDWGSNDYDARAEAFSDNVDPTGHSGGDWRVLRGGSHWSFAIWCRSAYRSHWPLAFRLQFVGFRVLLPAAPGT